MHPDNISPEILKTEDRLKQLFGLENIKDDEKYGELFIKYFEKFNPCNIKHATDYGCYVDFKHTLNFQGTNMAFQEFAFKTGLIPTAWWYKEETGITTIAFDKIFYPKQSALVEK